MGKSDSFRFLGKKVIVPKISEMDQFVLKFNTFGLFFKSVRDVFLKLHLMTCLMSKSDRVFLRKIHITLKI